MKKKRGTTLKIFSDDKLYKIKVPKVQKALSFEESVRNIPTVKKIFVKNCIEIGICSIL